MSKKWSTLLAGVTLAVALTLFAGFAWLTHHPAAAWLADAVDLPLVGPLAAAFRRHYLPPAPVSESAREAAHRIDVLWEDPATADDPGPVRLVVGGEAQPFVWVPEGADLRTEPASRSPAQATFPGAVRVTRLEQRGDWYRVRWGPREGWVHLPGYDETSAPPLGSAPEPVRPVAARTPEPRRLAAATARLRAVRTGPVGPYLLHTDVTDETLVERLAQVAGQLEASYRLRLGRTPIGKPAEEIVLFAERQAYEEFKEADSQLAGLASEGHVANGVVAICRGERRASEVETTLVHELSHLLNRRAIGPSLPPWLDEGIADELAESARDAAGRIEPGRLGGAIEDVGGGVLRLEGGWATLQLLRGARIEGRLVPLAQLAGLDWNRFMEPGRSSLHYAEAAFFVRYLLDGEGAIWRSPFHSFLAAVAAGASPDLATLTQHLDRTPVQLERGFRVWLAFQTLSEVNGTAFAAKSRTPGSGE